MKNIFLQSFLILLFLSVTGKAGNVTVTLIGIDPLTINIKGDTQNEEAGSISISLYYRDDGVTDLDIGNVDVTQITDTFGWGTGFQTKKIDDGSFFKGGHTFAKRLFYANAEPFLPSHEDDFWTISGINAIILDFTTVGTGNAFVEVNGDDGLADWTGNPHNVSYANQDIALPVELSSFEVQVSLNTVNLTWTTESEVNNLGFEVYRAPEQEAEYILLSSYETNSDLAGQGNSNTQHEYSYTDESVEPEATYWYKLADVDFNGIKTFHGPLSVTVPKGPEIPTVFKLHPNYPNPFNPSTTLRFDIPLTGSEFVDTKIVIYNSLGQVTKNVFEDKLTPGSYKVQWDGRNDFGNSAPSGIYFVVFKAEGFSQTRKIVLLK